MRWFAAAEGYSWAWFLTYSSRDQPANLSPAEAEAKLELFRHYGEELGRLMGAAAGLNADEWAWWGLKSYSRYLPAGTADPEHPTGCATKTCCQSWNRSARSFVATGSDL